MPTRIPHEAQEQLLRRRFIQRLCVGLVILWSSLAVAHETRLIADHGHEGDIAIDFSLSPLNTADVQSQGIVAGTDVRATLRLRDQRTGQPVTGIHPKGWMALRRSEMLAHETTCADKVKGFLGGALGARADIDLNSTLLFVMNHDKTISIINPHIALSRTKLENMIQLPGTGADWVLSQDKNDLYVTMPEQAAIAVIDTGTRKIVNQISSGTAGAPRRIALQPDGQNAWVGLDGADQVLVINSTTKQPLASVRVGRGLHSIAFTPDSRLALVTNSESDSLSIVETATLKIRAEIPTGKTPVAVAASRDGLYAYVTALNDHHISVVDLQEQKVHSRIPANRGTTALRLEPQGRFLFALNQLESTVSIIDTFQNTILGTSPVVKEPDQILFTQQFAYVRGLGSEKVSLIELGELKKGGVVPIEVQIGQSAPSAMPHEIGVADMMAAVPDGHGIMAASAPDQTIYYYMEGMMVPMGTFQTYKRMPRGLMILDRSLSEQEPGLYSTTVTLPKAGRYDVPVLIDHPRTVTCFQIAVAPGPAGTNVLPPRSVIIEPLFETDIAQHGAATVLKLRIRDEKTKEPMAGLKDVQALIFEAPGTWQQRKWAKETESGIYAVQQRFPRPGQYTLMVRIPSRGVVFSSKTQATIRLAGMDHEIKPIDPADIERNIHAEATPRLSPAPE